MNGRISLVLVALLSIGLSGCIPRGERPPPAATGKNANTTQKAERIVTQPARDVGASKIEVPPVLEMARENPYASVDGLQCDQIRGEMAQLDEALGPDFIAGDGPDKENKAGKLAAAGGQTVVNAIIPFRSLVREITGAAPAQRRLNDAVDAGYARRGFLRGMLKVKACPAA